MEKNLKTTDDLDLMIYIDQITNAKAVVIIIHGMGEHAGRYEELIEKLNSSGYSVLAFDHRGHGRSTGKRGHAPSYEHLMGDIENIINESVQLFPSLPVFLFSQSMGANLTLNYTIRKQDSRVKGVIASSPYLRLAFDPPKWKVFLGKMASGIYPGLSQSTGLEVAAISRIPEVVEKYKKDPLVHDKITASFFVNVHEAGPYAIQNAHEIKIPVLVLHGEADRLTSAEASRELVERSGDHVEGIFFPEGYHELHNEPNSAEVFQAMNDWMKKVLKGQ